MRCPSHTTTVRPAAPTGAGRDLLRVVLPGARVWKPPGNSPCAHLTKRVVPPQLPLADFLPGHIVMRATIATRIATTRTMMTGMKRLSHPKRLDVPDVAGRMPVRAGFVTAVKIPSEEVGQDMVDVVKVALSE